MSKHVNKYKGRQLRIGEFLPSTQQPLNKISEAALKVRSTGITALRDLITSSVSLTDEGRAKVRDLFAAMNYSVQEVNKELKFRSLRKEKK